MNIQWSRKQIDQSTKERAVGHASVIMLGENSDNRRIVFFLRVGTRVAMNFVEGHTRTASPSGKRSSGLSCLIVDDTENSFPRDLALKGISL